MNRLLLALPLILASTNALAQSFQLDLTKTDIVEIISEGTITLSASGACHFKQSLPALYVFYDDGEEGREAFVDPQGNLLWEMEDHWQETKVIDQDNMWQLQRTSTVEPYTLDYLNAISGCDISAEHLFTNTAKTRFIEIERYSNNSDSYQLKFTAEATAFADVGWQRDYQQIYKPTKLRMAFHVKRQNHY